MPGSGKLKLTNDRDPRRRNPGLKHSELREISNLLSKAAAVDAEFFDFIVQDSFCSVELAGGFSAITACEFKRILNQVFFERGNRFGK